MNYYIHDNIIYDLENNIPFLFLSKGYGHYAQNTPDYPNERNVFYNSSRCLSVTDPNLLVFAYSRKNVQYWFDILNNP